MAIITINRMRDFRRGMWVNLAPHGEGLVLRELGGVARGVVYLPGIDSGARDYPWMRAQADVTDFEGFTRISAFATDSPLMPGGGASIDDTIADPIESQSVKRGLLDPLYAHSYPAGRDVILSLRGRYLYLRVELVVTQETSPTLTAMRLWTAGDHMADYLPAVYRDTPDDFFMRYLSLFDSHVKDMERAIENLDESVDYEKASGGLLRFLAGWVGVDEPDLSDEALRAVIGEAVAFFETAHTPAGIRRLVERWTGVKPILVEHFLVAPMIRRGLDKEVYARLFGRKENSFCVMLPDSTFEDQQEAHRFLEKLSQSIPAHVEAELVLLREGIYLDWHTYLGVNSVIAAHTGAAIERRVALQYDTMIGGEQ